MARVVVGALGGRAIVVHDFATNVELASPPPNPTTSVLDWALVLQSVELAPLILCHLAHGAASYTCRAWREMLRTVRGQHEHDRGMMRHSGIANPIQCVGAREEEADVRCLAVLGGAALCVGDTSGLIRMWRLTPSGDVGRALGAMRHHQLRSGGGEGHVEWLGSQGDMLVSTGFDHGGRGSTVWATYLREGARERLEADDEAEFMEEEEEEEANDGPLPDGLLDADGNVAALGDAAGSDDDGDLDVGVREGLYDGALARYVRSTQLTVQDAVLSAAERRHHEVRLLELSRTLVLALMPTPMPTPMPTLVHHAPRWYPMPHAGTPCPCSCLWPFPCSCVHPRRGATRMCMCACACACVHVHVCMCAPTPGSNTLVHTPVHTPALMAHACTRRSLVASLGLPRRCTRAICTSARSIWIGRQTACLASRSGDGKKRRRLAALGRLGALGTTAAHSELEDASPIEMAPEMHVTAAHSELEDACARQAVSRAERKSTPPASPRPTGVRTALILPACACGGCATGGAVRSGPRPRTPAGRRWS